MENKMEMKELNLNEMSVAAGGRMKKLTEKEMEGFRFLRNLAVDIYKKLFVPTKTLD